MKGEEGGNRKRQKAAGLREARARSPVPAEAGLIPATHLAVELTCTLGCTLECGRCLCSPTRACPQIGRSGPGACVSLGNASPAFPFPPLSHRPSRLALLPRKAACGSTKRCLFPRNKPAILFHTGTSWLF